MSLITFTNIPIFLTLIRLIGSPLVLPIFLVYLLPFNSLFLNIFLVLLFALFCFTDFLDGYFARRYKQETVLGRILDPIADKFLLLSTLIALLAIKKIYFFFVIILLSREFFIMALRHVALEYSFKIDVFYVGKIKTTMQMLSLGLIILNPYQQLGFYGAPWWNGGELCLLLIAVGLSIYSAKHYYQFFMKQFLMQITIKINQ